MKKAKMLYCLKTQAFSTKVIFIFTPEDDF